MEHHKGYIHLYTGNGKGKTTAAIGLALRAAGAGKKVFIAQFVKGLPYSELEVLKKIAKITVKQYGLDCFIKNQPTQKDILAAQKGFTEVTALITQNKYDLIVLDEICIALHYNLIDAKELYHLLQLKPEPMELVLTGRYASPELYEHVDLLTEMKELKHYYQKGVEARKGIEY
ncbi:MAG: cob(I)yrinic acid a,c-diamide adenosyltransferase [Salinivirgaceae bacterium]|jgi:cob(I)alamin adenosyltransferase